MDREEILNTKDYDSVLKEVETNSPYKRLPSPAKKWMSVSEMGELLGLKKTDRYWLVHKNYFETKDFAGKMRINIKSFEKWYANQIKYHKVNGEEPKKAFRKWYDSQGSRNGKPMLKKQKQKNERRKLSIRKKW
ncbi:MAG: hypothetical protein ACI4CT_03310, partial [Lachnospiraceae bacterium]